MLGDKKDILLIDNLRATLKEKQRNKCKLSEHTVQQYKTITAKLQLKICSLKRETKIKVVEFEKANTEAFQIDPETKLNAEIRSTT